MSQQLAQLFHSTHLLQARCPKAMSLPIADGIRFPLFLIPWNPLYMKLHFNFRLHLKVTDKPNELIQTLEPVPTVYCNTNKTIGPTLTIRWVHLQQYPSATTALHPSCQQGLSFRISTVHPEWTYFCMCFVTLSPTSTELHQELQQHIAEAQCSIPSSCWFPNDFQAPEFKIGSHHLCQAQFLHTTQPSKKLSDKFLDCTKYLHDPSTHSHHFSNFRPVSALYTPLLQIYSGTETQSLSILDNRSHMASSETANGRYLTRHSATSQHLTY